MTKQMFRSFASALAVGVSLFATQGLAKSDITIAMQLEPPHLDPPSAAAQAIDPERLLVDLSAVVAKLALVEAERLGIEGRFFDPDIVDLERIDPHASKPASHPILPVERVERADGFGRVDLKG